MENVNIGEVYKKLRSIVGKDTYMSFDLTIDNSGTVKFCVYLSLRVLIHSESFSAPTPESLYKDVENWLKIQDYKNKKINSFNINLCK